MSFCLFGPFHATYIIASIFENFLTFVFMYPALLVAFAILLRIIANPLGNVFQKQLTARGTHPLICNFITYLMLAILCVVPGLAVGWADLPRTFWFFSVLVGITGALGNGFLVSALHKGELSVLGPINSYKPVVGLIGGILFLGEIPHFGGIIGIGLVIWGSYFVLDTTDERFTVALLKRSDIRYRLLAMIFTAIEAVFLKRVIEVSSPTIAFFIWCWSGALFAFILLFAYRLDVRKELLRTGLKEAGTYTILILSIGTMQFSTNFVFKHMAVGYALSLFQLSVLLSVFFGHRIFREKDIRRKMAGSAIMIAGAILIILLAGDSQ